MAAQEESIFESHLDASISSFGHKETLRIFSSIINEKINRSSWNGWETSRERTILYDTLLKSWFKPLYEKFNSNQNVALVAVGGQGRKEMTPCSDIDAILLIDDVISEDQPLIASYRDDVHYNLENKLGFTFAPIIYNLENLGDVTGRDLCQFIDMRFLEGNKDFANCFQEELKKNYDPLELFLHSSAFWEELKVKGQHPADTIHFFNIKERAMRIFHAAIWMQASETFSPSVDLYSSVPENVLDSYSALLKIRSQLHLKKEAERQKKAQKEGRPLAQMKEQDRKEADIMRQENFLSFPEETRARLHDALMQIYQYAETITYEKLKKGIGLRENGLIYGRSGISCTSDYSSSKPEERTQSLFNLLQISQRRRIPIDQSAHQTLAKDAPSWIQPCQDFAQLLYDKGSFASTLQELRKMNIIDKFLPGFSKLFIAPPDQDHPVQHMTKAALTIRQLRTLEQLVGEGSDSPHLSEEYALLDPPHQAAIKLALSIKYIPHLDKDSKGLLQVPLSEYLNQYEKNYPTLKSDQVLDTVNWLISNRSLLINTVQNSLNDSSTVAQLAEHCKNIEKLRSLLLFTYADKTSFISTEPEIIWGNVDELFYKTANRLTNKKEESTYDPYMFDDLGQEIIKDLGPDFHSSRYASLAPTIVPWLAKVYETKNPIIKSTRVKGSQALIIAAPDSRGLMAILTGQCYENDVDLRLVHAFSPSKHNLALDFFHIKEYDDKIQKLIPSLEKAIKNRTFISVDPLEILNKIPKRVSLEYKEGSGYYRLSFESEKDQLGILYSLTRFLYEKLDANIYAITAQAKKSKVRDYIFFKTPIPSSTASDIIKEIS